MLPKFKRISSQGEKENIQANKAFQVLQLSFHALTVDIFVVRYFIFTYLCLYSYQLFFVFTLFNLFI